MGRQVILTAPGLLAIVAPAAFGMVCATPLHGQILHASGPLPSFEVATIKPWMQPPAPPPPPPSADGTAVAKPAKVAPGRGGVQASDRVHAVLPTQMLIAFAYNLSLGFEDRVVGGPGWLSSEQYEIEGKIEGAQFAAMQTMTPEQQRRQVDLMEEALLADRFKLKVHFETREMPGYALVAAKGGPKLAAAKDGEASRLSMLGDTMTAEAVTLDQWIQSPFLGGRAIIDQTGLKGKFNFTLTWSERLTAADAGPDNVADAPSLLTAIQEQLGLKLVPTKTPVEVIVIDHIERPSEN